MEDSEWGKKRYVWVPLPDGTYALGQMTQPENSNGQIECKLADSGKTLLAKRDMIELPNHPKFDAVQDAANLTRLNMPSVLHLLKLRYHDGLIYTYSGLFCVVINPYRQLPIYGPQVMDRYRGKKLHEMEPHIYAVTDTTYRSMLHNQEDQSILCTGESGAGKTENTKKVIQHLTHIAGGNNGKGALEQKILQSNPILEAFGNAKTVKNDNSSRFGKFIRVNFDAQGKISGSAINTYILEKARIARQAKEGNERNFHIFYQMLAGVSALQKKELFLKSHSEYKYLSNGNVTVPSINDREEYEETLKAFETMNIGAEEVTGILQTLSFVLLMGNLTEKITHESRQNDQAKITDDEIVNQICQLAGVSVRDFNRALLKPKVKAGFQTVEKQQNEDQVKYSLEALSKAVYERLFDYLVKRINKSLRENTHSPGVNFIGILDIAGFEIFEQNSFEQLCINLTNEKLQQLFNHTLFIKEQEEYLQEKIEWTDIDYGQHLKPTIDLIEGVKNPPGIIALLDQACLFPEATDEYFNRQVAQQQGKNEKILLPKPNHRHYDFGINHYAGTVEYQTKDWLKKNMDQLNDNLVQILGGSKSNFMKSLWPDAQEVVSRQKTQAIQQISKVTPSRVKGGAAGKGLKRTVGALYRGQLEILMSTLNSTEPHFVRCIIPNHMKKANHLDDKLIMDQLKCNGVIEGIRIVRKGFPNKQTFLDFRQRYGILCPSISNSDNANSRKIAAKMLDILDLEDDTDYKLGISKIFFRQNVLAGLEDRRDRRLEEIVIKLQAVARGYW